MLGSIFLGNNYLQDPNTDSKQELKHLEYPGKEGVFIFAVAAVAVSCQNLNSIINRLVYENQ